KVPSVLISRISGKRSKTLKLACCDGTYWSGCVMVGIVSRCVLLNHYGSNPDLSKKGGVFITHSPSGRGLVLSGREEYSPVLPTVCTVSPVNWTHPTLPKRRKMESVS